MIIILLIWLALGVIVTAFGFHLDPRELAQASHTDLYSAEQFRGVVIMMAGIGGVAVPLIILWRLWIIGLFIRFAARNWYEGREQYYDDDEATSYYVSNQTPQERWHRRQHG
jgi:hypothetical protein